MLPLSPLICQCMRRFFVKRPKFLAAASSLCAEQNLVHLGRFLHFSQEVVGVTLTAAYKVFSKIDLILTMLFYTENLEPFGSLTNNCPKLDKNKSIVFEFQCL